MLLLILDLGACAAAPMSAAGPGAPFVLTTRGGPVQATSPPGVEVTLGAKQVRQAGERSPLE